MLPDWKEAEKLADNVVGDSDYKAATTNALPQDSEIPGLKPGTIFGGHYEILGVLGQGGMSTVYKARHVLVDGVRAIKVIRSEQADNSKVLRRFQQEGKAALALEHPNIGRVYEFGIEPALQKPYLVMDYVEGKTLSATLSAEGALTTERACQLIAQVCDGLQEAHSKGVVHRDIKPGNIILTKDSADTEIAKIVDFGIAKMIGPDDAQNLTQTGEVCGTPLYMSPEQCLGRNLDPRSDIYSLGCVLYECLTGRPPLQGASSIETIMMHANGFIPNFSHKSVPDSLKSVILKSLEREPHARYRSVAELKTALIAASVAPANLLTKLKNDWRLIQRQKKHIKPGTWIALLLPVLLLLIASDLMHKAKDEETSRMDQIKEKKREIGFIEEKKKLLRDEMKRTQDLIDGHEMKVQLIAEKRNDPVAWVGMAQELEQKGDLIDAERAFRKAIQLKPDYKNAWLGLGMILKKQGKSTDAAVAFRRADELKSDLEK